MSNDMEVMEAHLWKLQANCRTGLANSVDQEGKASPKLFKRPLLPTASEDAEDESLSVTGFEDFTTEVNLPTNEADDKLKKFVTGPPPHPSILQTAEDSEGRNSLPEETGHGNTVLSISTSKADKADMAAREMTRQMGQHSQDNDAVHSQNNDNVDSQDDDAVRPSPLSKTSNSKPRDPEDSDESSSSMQLREDTNEEVCRDGRSSTQVSIQNHTSEEHKGDKPDGSALQVAGGSPISAMVPNQGLHSEGSASEVRRNPLKVIKVKHAHMKTLEECLKNDDDLDINMTNETYECNETACKDKQQHGLYRCKLCKWLCSSEARLNAHMVMAHTDSDEVWTAGKKWKEKRTRKRKKNGKKKWKPKKE